jgi:catechol 2,3-dioxygenase-like lactoylglutathione lyase family enzyme
MLDHVFISVSDLDRSIAFYTKALAPLGITTRVGFVADNEAAVNAAYAAAIAAGAADNGVPSARVYYDPRYYAANVLDPDGYSLEFVYKSWQH